MNHAKFRTVLGDSASGHSLGGKDAGEGESGIIRSWTDKKQKKTIKWDRQQRLGFRACHLKTIIKILLHPIPEWPHVPTPFHMPGIVVEIVRPQIYRF